MSLGKEHKINIGYEGLGYAESRNIVCLLPEANYVQVSKSKPGGFWKKWSGWYSSSTERHLHHSKPGSGIDFCHFFNSIQMGSGQWGTTFETLVPFHDQPNLGRFLRAEIEHFSEERLIDRLAHESCKFLIPISQNAANIQKAVLEEYPSQKEVILSKMVVLPPPQPLLIKSYEKPPVRDGIHFMMLGRDLPRKGGIEVIRAFTKLFGDNPSLKLTMIGSLHSQNKRHSLTDEQLQELAGLARAYPSQLDWQEELPNQQLVRKMKGEVHVGLLPTHADTYGYSVLEFQATGCPVISTDIRALPEINDQECGWMINLAKNHLGEAVDSWGEASSRLEAEIETQLFRIVNEIISDPTVIRVKAEKALQRIEEYHHPDKFADRLRKIYLNCGLIQA
ncbi:glycosyltransferase family 4 protein [Aureitalea marina]|uniref:Glycosyl transferase family 1 domain-containing protein n=1 Tax=Aureitalea marina TaxID=930804 RepID=A0A2S7KMQ4_9FLAO|nr:glycosyltransferase family 4 protein [Aureitalea marina]PQB03878.1 hypothetical protein BST85_02375 [Aureitalea marina]